MLAIISIVTISKSRMESLKTSEQSSVAKYLDITIDNEFNKAEMKVLALLSQYYKAHKTVDYDNEVGPIYLKYLEQQLSVPGMNLTNGQARKIEKLVEGKSDVIKYEMDNDNSRISLDGKKLILYIDKEIYQTCGLSITFNANNVIEKIKDQSGNTLYELKEPFKQMNLQIDILIITLAIILILFILCIIVAMKNQLYVKGGSYNGFDEKEYA